MDGEGGSEDFVPPATVRAPATAAFMRRVNRAGLCLEHARAAVAGLERGGHVFGLTKGQFSMIDLAAAVLARTGMADVAVWTWCIAEYEVEAFSAFFQEWRIRDFRLVLDWTGAQRDMPLVADLQRKFGTGCIRVTKTHAKIVTLSTDDGWRVVIRGSMNLNANPRFEQFDVSDDPATFDVVEGVMGELWSRGKPLPVRELKHSDAADLLQVETPVENAAPGWWAPEPRQFGWWGG